MNGISNPRREKVSNGQYKVSKAEKKRWKELYGWEPPESVSEGRSKQDSSFYSEGTIHKKHFPHAAAKAAKKEAADEKKRKKLRRKRKRNT